MKRRALPLLVIAGLLASLVLGATSVAAKASGTASPALLMDKTPVVLANATAPGADYGLFTCQLGLSVGQCFDPYQMRAAYGIDSLIAAGYDGRGSTIVILDAFGDPNIAAQLDFFDTFYGLPPVNAGPGTASFTVVAPDGSAGYDAGWAEEISLDVLWAHAIAPGANIVLEIGKDNSDPALLSALNDAVRHHRGDVVSMSFGEADTCPGASLTKGWHEAFAKATLKNMTLFASSGDEGVLQPTCEDVPTSWIKSTSSPASDPLVTAVGGTELHAADYCLTSLGCDPSANPAPGTWQSEITWNEGPPYGDFGAYFDSTLATGGGYSTVWSKPFYQWGTVSGKHRGVPDVAYNAAVLHGVLTYLDIPGVPAGFYRFGGTSAGSPQWAAIAAIANQVAHRDLGFINAGIYRIGEAKAKYAASFHDITVGTNSALEFDINDNPVDVTGYNAGKGWDATTGLGSPNSGSAVGYLRKLVLPSDGFAAIIGSALDQVGHGHGFVHSH